MTGGLTRLASRTKVKKEETMKIKHQLSITDVEAYTLTHVALVRELVDLQSKQYALSQQHMQRDVLEDWYQTETELTRERGLWGPTIPSRYCPIHLLGNKHSTIIFNIKQINIYYYRNIQSLLLSFISNVNVILPVSWTF